MQMVFESFGGQGKLDGYPSEMCGGEKQEEENQKEKMGKEKKKEKRRKMEKKRKREQKKKDLYFFRWEIARSMNEDESPP